MRLRLFYETFKLVANARPAKQNYYNYIIILKEKSNKPDNWKKNIELEYFKTYGVLPCR